MFTISYWCKLVPPPPTLAMSAAQILQRNFLYFAYYNLLVPLQPEIGMFVLSIVNFGCLSSISNEDKCLIPQSKLFQRSITVKEYRRRINWIRRRWRSMPRAAVVHLNFRSGSTFPVPVCTALHGHWVNEEDNQKDYPVQQGWLGQIFCFL